MNDTLTLCPLENDVEDRCELAGEALTLAEGLARVRDEESAALIVLPAGYAAALENLTAIQIDYYSATDPAAPDPVRQTVDALLQQVNSAALAAGVADAMLERLAAQPALAVIGPWRQSFVRNVYTRTETLLAQRPPAVRLVTTGGAQSDVAVQGFGQSVPGMGSTYVMFTVLGGMAALVRERQRWTLQRLAVLPLTRSQILGGKMLTYFTLGMIQYWIVFAVGLTVGLDFGPHPMLMLPIMGAFVLCCTALTFAIAPSMSSDTQAGFVATLLALTFAPLGGAWWPLEIVSESMQRIGHLSPVAWAMDAFQDLLFYGGSFATILPELGVLLAAAAVLFGWGVWRFRYV
jgi:ABC-2 type transport system permease protein